MSGDADWKAMTEALISKPVGPELRGHKPAPVGNEITSRVEVGKTTASVEFNAEEGATVDGDSVAFGILTDQGLDPADWEVTNFSRSRWGSEDKPMESIKYSFRRRAGAELARVELDLSEAERCLLVAQPPAAILPGGEAGFLVLLGDMQYGKALSDDTPILTTKGWAKHGDVRPGDRVFGADGKPKRVLAVTGSTMQAMFRVTLRDGSSVLASGDHLWSGTRVMHPTDYRKGGPKWVKRHMVVSTRELAEITRQSSTRPFHLDASVPIELPEADFPVDPYVLGVWLGDGKSATGAIAVGVEDRAMIESWGTEIPSDSRSGAMYSVRVPGLTTGLRRLGVLGMKRVPDAYLNGSVEQRLALVQGLMDTDGHATLAGACEFANTNRQIVDSMAFLLRSLGMRPRITEHVGRLGGEEKLPYWRITFRATEPVFTLPRKLERLRPALERADMRRGVVSVEPAGEASAQCLTVEGSLYLAGEGLVVTHNCDGDGWEGALRRTIACIDRAADKLLTHRAYGHAIGHVHVGWLGDHIEGFESQGGANVWRTPLTLSEQIRLTRRVMIYAMCKLAPLAERLTMAAVPGNHGRTTSFEGKGLTRFDDSHDTEALIAAADAAALNAEAFGHVEFFVPDTDEMVVYTEIAGAGLLQVHGHQWRPGKHVEWWKGQAFHKAGPFYVATIMAAGHLHHLHIEQHGDRTYVGVPALEARSTWWEHNTGEGGRPAIFTALIEDGRMTSIEMIEGEVIE